MIYVYELNESISYSFNPLCTDSIERRDNSISLDFHYRFSIIHVVSQKNESRPETFSLHVANGAAALGDVIIQAFVRLVRAIAAVIIFAAI